MNRRLVANKKKLEQVVHGLKTNQLSAFRAADVFQAPLDIKSAKELLQVFRENKAVSGRVYDQYIKFCAARGDLGAVHEGLELASLDGFHMHDADSFIISAHASAGSTTRAMSLLRDRIAQGCAPRAIRVYNSLIRMLCSRGKIAEAEDVLSWGHVNSVPTAASYFPILAYARKKQDTSTAMRLYAQMCERQVIPDMFIFCELLNLFSHDDPRSLRLFSDMKKYDVQPTIVSHNIVIASEGRAGLVDAVRQRIEEMKTQDIAPDAMTYLALVHAYKARKDPRGAASVLEEMRKANILPHIETYSLVARCLFAAGDVDGVKTLLSDMETHGMRADSKFFAGLLNPDCTQPDWVIEEMEKRGIVRDAKMFDAQIRIFGSDDTQTMLRLYGDMRAQKLLPNSSVVSFLFHRLKTEEGAQMCKKILLELEDAGAKLEVKMYNMVLQHLSRAGDSKSCEEVLTRMKRSSHAHPDEHTYHSLVLGYGHAGLSKLAIQTLRRAQSEGFASPGLIGSVVGALGNINNSGGEGETNFVLNGEAINGEHEHGKGKLDVEGLMKEMCKSGLVTTRAFNDAIQFSRKDIETCTRLYKLMEANNVRRDAFTYNLLMRIAMRNDDSDLAFQLASSMRESKIPFDSHMYNTLIQLAAKRGDFDVCEQLLTRMHSFGGVDCVPDAKSYRTVIIELVRGEKCELERAQKLVGRMMSYNIVPDNDTTYWVLNGLFDSGAINEVLELTSKIRKMQGYLHRYTYNHLMREFIWRGDTTHCEELLDREDLVKPPLTVYDFSHVFSTVVEKKGGDSVCSAYVIARMLELDFQPNPEIFQHLAKIYSKEFGWNEGEERSNEEIAQATKQLLQTIPELFSVSKAERIAQRDRKEKLMTAISTPLHDQYTSAFEREEFGEEDVEWD